MFVLLVFLLLLVGPARAAEPVRVPHAIVVSAESHASQAGVDILRKGGNAVDAAVATALALAVTYPQAGNLGGGGFMLIHVQQSGTDTSIDYRETAPAAATHDVYLDKSGEVIEGEGGPVIGYRAPGVPGTVAGLWLAKQRYGNPRVSWAQLVEPARRLAADGFPIGAGLAEVLNRYQAQLSQNAEARRILVRSGHPWQAGDILQQPDLADTLQRLTRGPADFYQGRTAHMIAEDLVDHRGLITLSDLRRYRAVERPVVRGSYRGYPVVSMGPPSSGGVILIEMLNILEGFDLHAMGRDTPGRWHLLVETMRRAFADRSAYMGDTDFVKVPVEGLMDKAYAARVRATIDLQRATPSSEVKPGVPEGTHTTHFCVIDADGNAVSNTYTLNDNFGAKVVARGTGVLLNDEMDDFASKPGTPNMFSAVFGEKNSIAPHKRPLSAMTPTFVMHKDGTLWFAIGSPGGPTIINTVLQIIVHVVDDGMNLQDAVDAPRVHHQWEPDLIYYEPDGLSNETMAALQAMGHRFVGRPRPIGLAQGAMIDLGSGQRLGATDAREPGGAIGY